MILRHFPGIPLSFGGSVMKTICAASSALLLLLALATPSTAQDEVTIETHDLGSGIYALTGRGGNIGLCVGEDGAFLIDDQYAPLTEKILAAIAELTDQPVKFVVNTHWHGDHTGGNENLGKAGAVLMAHENVRVRMSTDQFSEFFNDTRPASPETALPVITFTDAVTFYFNDEEIHVFHVENAHTDGDAIVHFKNANVIHMGDLFFNGLYPFIDIESGGSAKGVLAAVDLVLARADEETKIVPGHGPPVSDRGELRAYRDMLATIVGRIEEAIAQGKSMDEIKAGNPTSEWDEVWGKAWLTADQMVEILYADLTR
jgi:glyoxylase-like metal-dependent hydrolase (beta-lactamase superfamily II)